MGDDAGDSACDDMGDGAWMSYEELAVNRGITRRAAVRLTQRHRLRRQLGNDGLVRVWVPADMAKPSQRQSQGDDARDNNPMAGALAALEGAVAALTARAEAADRRVDQAEARADRAEQAVVGERARSDAAVAKADALRDRLEAAQTELTEMVDAARAATEAADALRVAEASRKARKRLARLRAAWRGA